MRKRFVFLAAVVLTVAVCGCSQAEENDNLTQETVEEQTSEEKENDEESLIELHSNITKDECGVCGRRSDSLMPYYHKFDSVGILFLNTGDIGDTRVRTYTDDGTEIFRSGHSTLLTNHSESGYRYSVDSNSDRGIATMDITYDSTVKPDFDFISNWMCQDCIDLLADAWEEEMLWTDCSKDELLPFVFIDFQTYEMQSLGSYIRSFTIRDYYVRVDHAEEEIELLVFYAPTRDESN